MRYLIVLFLLVTSCSFYIKEAEFVFDPDNEMFYEDEEDFIDE